MYALFNDKTKEFVTTPFSNKTKKELLQMRKVMINSEDISLLSFGWYKIN